MVYIYCPQGARAVCCCFPSSRCLLVRGALIATNYFPLYHCHKCQLRFRSWLLISATVPPWRCGVPPIAVCAPSRGQPIPCPKTVSQSEPVGFIFAILRPHSIHNYAVRRPVHHYLLFFNPLLGLLPTITKAHGWSRRYPHIYVCGVVVVCRH